MASWGVRREVDLGAELRAWRERKGLSLRALATELSCDHSRVWKIENGKMVMTREIAAVCDRVLDTGGALVAAWSTARDSIRPAQLPAGSWLVGRDRELGELSTAVRVSLPGAPAVVAIDGPAGAGKTTLALRLAHQIAGKYVDGQLYADLGGFAAGKDHERMSAASASHDVLAEFLMAMGVTVIPDTTRERAALYRSVLADRRVLVVLDNVADVSDVRPLLPATASCGAVVTSRKTLVGLVGEIGATHLTVGPLTESAAVALISRVIGEQRADAAAADVVTLANLCGQLPMALRAAADELAIFPHRSPADLVTDLTEGGDRLVIGEPTDLATMLSWSYRTLAPDEARLFRLLGLHRDGGQLTIEAVAVVAGLTLPVARRLVRRLATIHLVEIDARGVGLHSVVHAYARKLFHAHDTDDDRRAAVRRLAGWYHHADQPASSGIDNGSAASDWSPATSNAVTSTDRQHIASLMARNGLDPSILSSRTASEDPSAQSMGDT